MKKIIALLVLAMPLMAGAQKTHTVAAKESFYSIGRMYNVHPKELAAYNHISFEQGLSIGQVIKIPPTAAPMPATAAPQQKAEVPEAPAPVPVKKANPVTSGQLVYHTVAPKEGLYSISKKYQVSIADIKKWNQLSGDAISIGSQLIVGYADAPAPTATTAAPKPVAETKPSTPTAVPAPTPKPEVVVAETKPAVQPVATYDSKGKGGYFKAAFDAQEKNASAQTQAGMVNVFKSTSGWNDGKYYCLHNTAPAGSIVKFTNVANGRVVYAKVLDLIPELKQNRNLVASISNAAATELGAANLTTFECTLLY